MATPALPPLPYPEWSEEARTILPGLLRRPELYDQTQPDARPMPQALGLFAHHVHLGAAWMGITEMLVGEHSSLDPAIRELAILRVAWAARSNYEWKQHVRIGLASGLTTAQLYAVAEGPGAGLWTPLERAVVEAADQSVARSVIEPATWSVLAEHLDPAQLLELTFAIGAYLAFGIVVNSVGLEADPPTEPVDAPEMPED